MAKKAYCIGIDDYGNQSAPDMSMTTLNLKGCVNDAHDWANLLVRHYDFSVGDVTLLTDADATRANILKGIKSLMAGAQEGDVLVLTSSSHGFYTKDVSGDEQADDTDIGGGFTRPPGSYDEAIVPYDYPKLIIDDELRELFDGIPTGVYLTFIADSCFSGSLTDADFSGKSPEHSKHSYNEILMTGTTDHHMSGDAKIDDRPNGFMTYHAIKAIREAGYRITYDKLHENMLISIANEGSKYKDQNPGLEASEEHKKLYIFTNEFEKAPATAVSARDESKVMTATHAFSTVYFFRGDRYVRFDVATGKVDEGYPLPIAGNWKGFSEAGFSDGVDAAVNWGNGKVYFFRGDRYVRFTVAAAKVDDGYPLPIAGNWKGFSEAGFSGEIKGSID
ncbi:MAG: hemopexin repeat-containing protein [Pseudonocardiaceae bacterium]